MIIKELTKCTMNKVLIILVFAGFTVCCSKVDLVENNVSNDDKTIFIKVDVEKTGISFSNRIKETPQFNFINYPYVYNGGGVSAADFNNDGLVDLYFTANQTTNKLYLNKGSFEFEDITESAGVSDAEGWTTGTTVLDINNDGWLDLYVCKSGSLRSPNTRENKLYINQRDNTFLNEADKWGLNDPGFSIQTYPIDFDKDGDLDLYLVNHRPDFENNVVVESTFTANSDSPFTDRLYRNDGNLFVDVSSESKIQNNAWGLSAVVGDFNNDNWPDIYVSNDFLEPDFLYINNQNGEFEEKISSSMGHISMNSMGSDYGDINNDGLMDLLVAEMSPSDHIRSKKNMPSMSTENFESMVAANYNYQYMSNSLQLNEGNGKFSEIAQMAGIAKTDWSWAPIMADFDNDGHKDVFVTNGIIKDLSNSDFRNKLKSKISKREKMSLEQALSMIPSNRLDNLIFKNNADLTFTQINDSWGMDTPSFSHGTVTADLDNDGDLDIVVNNANDSAFIYKNNTTANSLQIELKGGSNNVLGIGAKAIVYQGEVIQASEMYLSRGYQSSQPNVLHFGLDSLSAVDSVEVFWPDNKLEIIRNVKANQKIMIEYDNSLSRAVSTAIGIEELLQEISSTDIGISFRHQENDYNDYKKQLLLPYKLSQSGPFVTKGDVNMDGLEDFFVGGAAGQTGQLYLQQANGTFTEGSGEWVNDRLSEDVGGIFFDIDNDDDLDLYVVSGGNEFEIESDLLRDRLYLNENGIFKKSLKSVPDIRESGKVVIADDYDNDGDLDLFVGGRLIPGEYPTSPTSYFLTNENGVLIDNSALIAPGLERIGMITGAVFSDYDSDGDNDLLTVGEWNNIQLLENVNGIFGTIEIPSLENSRGLWFSLSKKDIDDDGDDDYFIGNLGLNSKYKSEKGKEFHIYAADFDASGTIDIALSNKYNGELVPVRGRECSSQQTPFIQSKFPDYNSFAQADMNEIFGKEKLSKAIHYQADILESIVLLNNQEKGFEIIKLPNQAQVSPIFDFEFLDVDKDGVEEILAVGNMYETEVETVRMDGARGHVLKWNQGSLKVLPYNQTGFISEGNARSVIALKRGSNDHCIIVGNNNSNLNFFKTVNKVFYEK